VHSLVRVVAAGLLCAALCVSSAARADDARAGCTARLVGGRALVSVTLERFLDPALLRLVRLGLDGRLQVQATLFRRRRAWFDAREVDVRRRAKLSHTRSRGRIDVEGARSIDGTGTIVLDTLSLLPDRAAGPDERYYVEIEARLEVVTAQTLGRVATWMADADERRERSPGVVSRRLLESVAGDLERVAAGSCEAVR